jgi:hypothetical protein
MEWKLYRKTATIEARPYVAGEDLKGVAVNPLDSPAEGGMVCRDPQNHQDSWYCTAEYFKVYEKV